MVPFSNVLVLTSFESVSWTCSIRLSRTSNSEMATVESLGTKKFLMPWQMAVLTATSGPDQGLKRARKVAARL